MKVLFASKKIRKVPVVGIVDHLKDSLFWSIAFCPPSESQSPVSPRQALLVEKHPGILTL